jgi:polysaccharide pyruvyl transferase WcaK-like protein
MTKILITGYYGLGNIGDEAILSGIISSLNAYVNDAKISVITNYPNETRALHNVLPVSQSFKKGFMPFMKKQILRREMLQVYQAIKDCDIFILGGGELLQDLKVYYLPILLSLVRLAQKKKKKTVIYGIGAGPIETKLGKTLCKNILNDVDLITVRDSKSRIALENCGVQNVKQTADPAFAINVPHKGTINNILLENVVDRENIIGVTLHNLLYDDDIYRKSNGAGIDLSYRRKILANIFDSIAEKYNRRLMFLPTVGTDINGYMKINQFMSNRNKTAIIDHNSDFRYFLSLLSVSDVLIGMRLHSLIIYLDIEDIDRGGFNEKLDDNFSEVWNNRSHYSSLLLKHSDRLRKKVFENAKMVSDLISEECLR